MSLFKIFKEQSEQAPLLDTKRSDQNGSNNDSIISISPPQNTLILPDKMRVEIESLEKIKKKLEEKEFTCNQYEFVSPRNMRSAAAVVFLALGLINIMIWGPLFLSNSRRQEEEKAEALWDFDNAVQANNETCRSFYNKSLENDCLFFSDAKKNSSTACSSLINGYCTADPSLQSSSLQVVLSVETVIVLLCFLWLLKIYFSLRNDPQFRRENCTAHTILRISDIALLDLNDIQLLNCSRRYRKFSYFNYTRQEIINKIDDRILDLKMMGTLLPIELRDIIGGYAHEEYKPLYNRTK